ncbi:MAG TPA: NAD(P)/FAD-dependent oxidoreductase [Usitatibacter sp.]|jgi:NADPH-dependent 2,4-dienoyl-CoA reductase/sulfur reductase-like enzyme|nr:NAD(P)/FAD-dependent oxidoreductase [Usitatibacter sp.]
MRRRAFLALGALSALALAPAARAQARGARVAVVGGGYGGATAARYLRLLDPSIEVTLVEPEAAHVTCPLSNLVIGGFRELSSITIGYDRLAAEGVRVVRDRAVAVDAGARRVRLARGDPVRFDRAIVSPGIDFMWGELPALGDESAREAVPHAWKAGPQTAILRRQLEAMPDGGTFVISIPEAPFRCPPGPYERACQAAAYFKLSKPRARVVIVDANEDVLSKGALFRRAWKELYPGMVDYRPNSKAVDVDIATRTVKLEFEDVKADVLNVIPPMKAGEVAAPFITANGRWCEVDWLTYESRAAPGVHVLGDSLQIAPLMPKSATMANAQAKACAAAVARLLAGQEPNPAPTLVNACYSWVSPTQAVHVASVHKYDPAERTMKPVPGAGGLSPDLAGAEMPAALAWERGIRADAFAWK